MCGIFGFALAEPVKISRVFRLLERLETHQYPGEEIPLGGYGAGIAILMDDGTLLTEKVGADKTSPVKRLEEIVDVSFATILLAHVRYPSPEFMDTAKHKETAQPYVVQMDPNLTIVSVHNGKLENYRNLQRSLRKSHKLETENIQLIDSEVIPHIYEQILNEKADTDEALYELLHTIQGPNSIALLQATDEQTSIHLIHKGKTRGLVAFTNDKSELVFCSRPEPLQQELHQFLIENKLREKIDIRWREDIGLKMTFPIEFKLKK